MKQAEEKTGVAELLKEFIAGYARLSGKAEKLCTPKYDHYVEGASDFSDIVERKFPAHAHLLEVNRTMKATLEFGVEVLDCFLSNYHDLIPAEARAALSIFKGNSLAAIALAEKEKI